MPEVAVLIAAIDRLLEASARVVREERLVPIERRLTNDLALAFRAEGRAFLRGFRNLADPAKWPLDEAQWMRYLVEAQAETLPMWTTALERAVGRALMAGMAKAAESMPTTEALREADPGDEIVVAGIRFDLRNPRAVAYLEAHGAELVRGIDETTRDYIRTVLVEGASKGWSYNEMARRISDRYKEFSAGRPQLHIDSRAHMIAVTEVGNSYAEGNLQVAQGLAAAGLKMEKSWLTVGDDRVEAICLGNEAEGWIPLEQTFSSGHMRPLAHPACRCAMLTQRVGAGARAAEPERRTVPRFTNRASAEKWARENLGIEADYERMSTEQAQAVTDALERARRTYQKDLPVGAVKPMPEGLRSRAAAARLGENRTIFVDERYFTETGLDVSRRVETEGRIAKLLEQMRLGQYTEIETEHIQSRIDTYRRALAAPRWGTASNLEEIITHEIGHAVESDLSAGVWADIFDFLSPSERRRRGLAWMDSMAVHLEAVCGQPGALALSEYATTNGGEYFAEAFVAFSRGEFAPIEARLLALFRRILR